ncbi:SpoIIE family protein phosphatase [Nocardioides nanhaiensis]
MSGAAPDADAVLAAFEHVPMMVAVCEGDPLVVSAHNALARGAFGDRTGLPLRDALADVASSGIVEHMERVRDSGTPFTASSWPFVLPGADGVAVELYADVVIYPYFADDGTVRGVAALAVDASATPASQAAAARAVEASPEPRPRAAQQGPRDLVAALQDAMLPPGLPVVPQLQMAARCLLPAGEAGGDWYDVIPLDDGRVVLCVGDVVGHGVAATVVMGELRALFEERVREDGDVVAALELLCRRAQRSLPARGATVCAAVVEPAKGAVRYVTAGHPPPLVIDAHGRARFLAPSGGGALGVGHRFQAADHRLAEGEMLLLYTDGLVERVHRSAPGSTLDLGHRVADAWQRAMDGAPTSALVERVATGLLDGPAGREQTDDVVVLLVQRTSPAVPLELDLPAEPEALEVVRDALGTWLAPLGISRIDHTVLQHSVGELVANVVEHAYAGLPPERRGDVVVRASHLRQGVLEVSVSDRGTWRPPVSGSGRGRGLAMVRGFCDELEVAHGPAGTEVCLRHQPHGSAELLLGEASGGAARTDPLHLDDSDGELAVGGVVDTSGADLLRHRLAKRSAGGLHPLLVDLSAVSLLASAGVQALVDALQVDQGLRLLAPLGSPAQRVLDLVELPYQVRREG